MPTPEVAALDVSPLSHFLADTPKTLLKNQAAMCSGEAAFMPENEPQLAYTSQSSHCFASSWLGGDHVTKSWPMKCLHPSHLGWGCIRGWVEHEGKAKKISEKLTHVHPARTPSLRDSYYVRK